jgi:hypothetical protein
VIFGGNVVVCYATLRQHRAYPDIAVIAVGRRVLAHDVFAEPGTIFDTENATDCTGCGANSAADDCSKWTGRSVTRGRSFFRPSNSTLCLRRQWQR